MSVRNCLFRCIGWALGLIRKHFHLLAYVLMMIFSLWNTRLATSNYKSVARDQILQNLVRNTTLNMTLRSTNLPECKYDDILNDNEFVLLPDNQEELHDPSDIRPGGEYYPSDCRPAFSTAIVVVYRAREKQLHSFLVYMHNYLRRQRIHYRIFIIEQNDAKPFNRGKLFNVGFKYASRAGFPCLVLHDVDLMPMRLSHMYACTLKPRHMCASLLNFRFNMLYGQLFGGAVAIESSTFSAINGYSNMFQGWGAEDDDLFGRLSDKNIGLVRFSREVSQYVMMIHPKQEINPDRLYYLYTGSFRYSYDGLNSLRYREREFALHQLFTHARVDT